MIDDERSPRIGPAGEAMGLSARMVRYFESQGVIRPERGPGPSGHRHFPPPELHLGRAAALATDAGHPTATLRALRELADRRVEDARRGADPLAWFELLALARAVEVARRVDEPHPPQPPRGSHPPHPRGPRG